MEERELGERIFGWVHRTLGPGLLESAYEACLAHELGKAGLGFQRQLALPVIYDGVKIDLGYRLDLVVAEQMVIEIKAVEKIAEIHLAQLLSYLKLGGYRIGYVLNFNVRMLKDGICRLANGF